MAEFYGLLGHLNRMETLLMLLVTPVIFQNVCCEKGLLSRVLAAAYQKSHDPDCISPTAAVSNYNLCLKVVSSSI